MRKAILQLALAGALAAAAWGNARAQGLEDPLVVVVDGEHQDGHLRKLFFQDLDALDAVHPREPDVT